MSRRVLNLLAAIPDGEWCAWRPALENALREAGIAANLGRGIEPHLVDYIIYTPTGRLDDFTPYTRARAVLSLWAGVERIIDNPTLTQPLARMADAGLAEGMREWVAGQVLRHHLALDLDICRATPDWAPRTQPLARDRQVGILGLGALGQAVAGALVGLGFAVSGWSRREKTLPGVACHAGAGGLARVLAKSEILVLLLPLTGATENIMNAPNLRLLPKGAVLINPGRGGLIDDSALIAALDAGQLSHATLDVFRSEPLPKEHPFWRHPKVTVSPHIAAPTRPEIAARQVAENIRRSEAGEPLLNLVDRAAGY